MTFDAEGVRAKHFGGPDRAMTMTPATSALRRDLRSALDRITELEAALAAAEGARLAAERGLAREGA